MSVPPNLVAVIVAAGSSQRMGFDKLTAPLLGHPLIVHTLAAFQNCPDVASAVLVCAADRVGEFQALAAEFNWGGPGPAAGNVPGMMAEFR